VSEGPSSARIGRTLAGRPSAALGPARPSTSLPLRAGKPRSPWREFAKAFLGSRTALLGLAVLAPFLILGLGADVLAPASPRAVNAANALAGPGPGHWFGTDELGRDIFSRVIYGARISIVVGVVAVGLSMVVGVPVGLTMGYFGGRYDSVMGRFLDALFAFPPILLAIALMAVLRPSATTAMIAIGITNIATFARVARSAILAQKERDYVLASRTVGAGSGFIIWRALLPNCVCPIIVAMSLSFAYAILAEAGLSFLGIGTQPPDPSWGSMLQTAQGYLLSRPSYALFPGAAIFLFVLGLNLVGDGMQDAMDPRRRGT
jgi:ABC-type dipeptide/oligopeptide/nickel transport system permease subunit